MPILPYAGHWPRIAPDAFVAPTAVITGDVTIEGGASVWFGAVIRAEMDRVVIGRGTNVQDNCVIHVDAGFPCLIGEECTLGHSAVVHGAKVGDHTLIGMHATILNGAVIGSECIVSAGAVVPEGRAVPDGTLAMGLPARSLRPTTAEERQRTLDGVGHYRAFAAAYRDASPATEPATAADDTTG